MNELLQTSAIGWLSPEMIIKGVVLYSIMVWLCILVWVIRDVTNRTRSVFIQIIVVMLVFLCMPIGLFIYILFRPQKTLFEKIFEDEFIKLDHAACLARCQKETKAKKISEIQPIVVQVSSFSPKKRIKKSTNTESK